MNASITENEIDVTNATLKLGYYTHDDALKEFTIAFNPNSTLIQNSKLGNFMSEIGTNLSVQSDNSAIRFIMQASQVGTDTKKQAAIADAGAQLNAIGANHAHMRSAIQAKHYRL